MVVNTTVPLCEVEGLTHGDDPKLIEKLYAFSPVVSGVAVPVIAHPLAVVPLNEPVVPIAIVIVSVGFLLTKLKLYVPAIVDNNGGVLNE